MPPSFSKIHLARTAIKNAADSLLLANWVRENHYKNTHIDEALGHIKDAIEVLGYRGFTLSEADPATAIDGGKQEGDDPISPVGGGDAATNPIPAAERVAS